MDFSPSELERHYRHAGSNLNQSEYALSFLCKKARKQQETSRKKEKKVQGVGFEPTNAYAIGS